MPRTSETCGPKGVLKRAEGGVYKPHKLSGHPNAGHSFEGDWLSPLLGASKECTVMAWADSPGIWLRQRLQRNESQGGTDRLDSTAGQDWGWEYTTGGGGG